MSYFYLIASLPAVSMEHPPLSAEAFASRCEAQLSVRDQQHVQDVLKEPLPPAAAAHPFCRAWRNREVQVRNAIAKIRAARRHADASRVIRTHAGFSACLESAVEAAFALPSPLEREKALDQIRWNSLEELQGVDPFSFTVVLAYAVKQRIASRWATMDKDAGWQHASQSIEQQPTRDTPSRDSETETAAASGA